MPSPFSRDEFAQALNEARLNHHLSIRAAAKVAGVPAATVQGWLSGKHLPTPALRSNYLLLVEELGLADEVPDDLWVEPLPEVQPALRTGNPPYLGLRPFAVSDQAFFHGRKTESVRLAHAVAELRDGEGHGIIALVGPSGSGKSSLLAAGLVAGECTDGELAGWTTRSIAVADLAGSAPDESSLVVIDQFEDVLLLPDEPRRAALDALLRIAAEAVVVIALRSDAYAAASQEPALLSALSRPVLLSPLTRQELREVIVAPAHLLDIEVDEDLVQVLEQDLAPGSAGSRVAPDVLPLLSTALLVTWAAGRGERMTVSDYHSAGGVAQAVESLAEQVYGSLSDTEQVAAKTMFLRLISLASDVVVREPLPLTSLDADTRAVMDAFVAARMLTITGEAVRISHDALLEHWARLNEWIEESRNDLQVLQQLRRAAQFWVDTERDPDSLIPVGRLPMFQDWLSDSGRHYDLLAEHEREFVQASEQHFASLLDQEKRTSDRLRRRGRVAVTLTAVTTALALIAGFLYLQGRGYQLQAEQARNDAQSRQVATAAHSIRSLDPNLQAQMSLVAADISATQEGRSALLDAAAVDSPIRWLGAPTSVVAASPDQTLVARGNGSGQVTLWRGEELTTTRGTTFTVDPEGGSLFAVALGQRGGRQLLAVGGAGVRALWDVTAEPVLVEDLKDDEATTYALAFSADGARLALGTSTGDVEVWSVPETGSPVLESALRLDLLPPADGQEPTRPAVSSVAFGPGGQLAVAGAPSVVTRWRLEPEPRRLEDLSTLFEGSPLTALSVAFSPDGSQLAAGLRGRALLRWTLAGDAATPEPPLTEFTSWVNAVAYSPAGDLLIAGSSDQTTRLYDPRVGSLEQQLPGPSIITGVGVVRGHPVTASTDGTLRVWPATSPLWRTAGAPVYNLATDAAGAQWLGGGTASDGSLLWKLGDPAQELVVPPADLGEDVQIGAAGMAPNGAFLLGGTREGLLISWPLADGRVGEPRLADSKAGYMGYTAVSPDSTLVAGMEYGRSRTVLFRADATGRLSYLSTIETPVPQMVSFSPDNRLLAVALAANKVQLWSLADPAKPVLAGEIDDFSSAAISVAYAPISPRVAVGTDGGAVTVWDVTDPAAPKKTREYGDAHSSAYGVVFSPDEKTLVASTGEELVWGWDLAASGTPALFALSGELGRPWDLRFLDGGKRLAVSGDNGGVRVWIADEAAANDHLCQNRGDVLTAEEWQRYLPGIEPRDPC